MTDPFTSALSEESWRSIAESKDAILRSCGETIRELEAALENLTGDVYLYSLKGDGPEGREIAWTQVLKTQGEAIRALRKARKL